MKKLLLSIILWLWIMVAASAQVSESVLEFDTYGGLKKIRFDTSGYFRAQNDGQRWWLVTPEGHAFLSIGICYVNPNGDVEKGTDRSPYKYNIMQKYQNNDKWSEATRSRLKTWGVNTLGAWSEVRHFKAFPYTLDLSLTKNLWENNQVPDFFDPQFAQAIQEKVADLKKYCEDPWLVGYFLDNELPWSPDWRLGPGIFTGYLQMPADRPGKQRFVEYFKGAYESPEAFSKVWSPPITNWDQLGSIRAFYALETNRAQQDREAFSLQIARQYFKVLTEAVRQVDKNHLILGCRFIVQTPPKVVVQACGEYCDVVSINFYELGPMGFQFFGMLKPEIELLSLNSDMKAYYDIADKPLMITEFGFRGMDSGLPNTHPNPIVIQPTVATQADRAKKYKDYVEQWMGADYMVGYHWFKYMDEPAKGRYDGENGNYGFVDINDEPYAGFLEGDNGVIEINRKAWPRHQESGSKR